MLRKILVATDGSWLAECAARAAVALAKGSGAKLVALSAAHAAPAGPANMQIRADLDAAFVRAHQDPIAYAARVAGFAQKASVPCQPVTAVSAFPGDEIIHAAEQNACDLIILGAHGGRTVPPLLAGGVGQQVLGYVPVPALMLRDAAPGSQAVARIRSSHFKEPPCSNASCFLPTGRPLRSVRSWPGSPLPGIPGAVVNGLTVVLPFHTPSADSEMLESTPVQYERHAREQAGRILADVEKAAREAQVPYRIEQASGDSPWETVIAAARNAGCDLILMASHGRKGIRGLLLGGETQKVLVHSAIPVLVYR